MNTTAENQVARVGSCAQCGGFWLDEACGPTHAAVQYVAEHPVEVYVETIRLKDAMRTIQKWDCLNPPQPQLLADLPWLRRVVDEALEGL